MNGPSEIGAVVVGGGLGGLVAAAYLARCGLRVVLLEEETRVGGGTANAKVTDVAEAPLGEDYAYALDPRVVSDLELVRHGLRFAEPEMALTALGPRGRHLFLPRDFFTARASIAGHAPVDALQWRIFRNEMLRLGRQLKPFWHGDVGVRASDEPLEAIVDALHLSPAAAAKLEALARSSAVSYLDRWFESEPLKTALAFDAAKLGLSSYEPGSALALVWRYAQESEGLQAACAQIQGGPAFLAEALATAARQAGAGLHMNARVLSILVEDGVAAGVALANGMEVRAPIVISSLPRSATLFGLLPPSALPLDEVPPSLSACRFAHGKVVFHLAAAAPFIGLAENALRGRMIVAERPESAAEAKGAALRGEIARDLVLEVTVPTAADTSLAPAKHHVLSARVHFLPTDIDWASHGPRLAKRVAATLENFAPGFKDRVIAQRFIAPGEASPKAMSSELQTPLKLLMPYSARVRTPVRGLYLCGKDAEPAIADSGRAGRMAAIAALDDRALSRVWP